MAETAPDAIGDDLVLLLQACAAALGERVLADVRAVAGEDVRFNDGYVFQHLLGGARSVTSLAEALGITQQAASKQVADLEARGLVVRRSDPRDARTRLVELSSRGHRAVEAGRASRRAARAEIDEQLGARRAATFLAALREIGDATGAVHHLATRRLRPESQR